MKLKPLALNFSDHVPPTVLNPIIKFKLHVLEPATETLKSDHEDGLKVLPREPEMK